MKYFGILKDKNFRKANEETKQELLNKLGIAKTTNTIKLFEGDSNNLRDLQFSIKVNISQMKAEKVVKYEKEVLFEIHKYIYLNFKNEVQAQIKLAYLQSGIANLDLESKEKRKESYREIFNKTFLHVKRSFSELINETISKEPGLPNLDVFHDLKVIRESLVNGFEKEPEMIENYLIGDKESFTQKSLEENPIIVDLINFEISLGFLIDINNVCQFHENNYFTGYPELDYSYNSLIPDLFIKPGLITIFIRAMKEYTPTIFLFRCLFYGLREKGLLAHNKKLFMDFCNNNFSLTFKIDQIKKIYNEDWSSEQERYQNFLHFLEDNLSS